MAREVSGRDDMRFALCGEDDTIYFLRGYIMNLFDLNSDKIIYNIDGKDMEMKPAICYDKVYDRWLVSKCGKVWSLKHNRLIKGNPIFKNGKERSKGKITCLSMTLYVLSNFWEDGSGSKQEYSQWNHQYVKRNIKQHKIIMDTWKPLYDNPPESIVWEEWEIVRDLPSVYNHISKTVVIDHIDDDPTNNHLDNLRRVTSWDNNFARKARGI